MWECFFDLPELLSPVVGKISKLCKDSSKEEWLDCLTQLREGETRRYKRYLCNDIEGSASVFPNRRWTFQHHAAYHSAPKEVIEKMIEMGFPMSYKDGDMKIPLDYVADAKSDEYKALFKYKFPFENVDISKVNHIEEQFHKVINLRVKHLVIEHNLILPILSVVLEQFRQILCVERNQALSMEEFRILRVHCPIPHMYGGFNFYFESNADKFDIKSLKIKSFSRIVGGSEQEHRCTEKKFTQIYPRPPSCWQRFTRNFLARTRRNISVSR